MLTKLLKPILLAVLLPALVAPMNAQMKSTGAVLGRVTDPSGAVVPGATVTLTNVGTGAVLRTQANTSGDVPIGKNMKGGGKAILGGWQLSGITRFQSGSPLTVYAPGDVAGIGAGGQRPNAIASPDGSKTLASWFNTSAFAQATRGTFGNASVGIIRGPGINNWDMALYKTFPLPTERLSMQFRAQFFNIFNHTQYAGVDTGLGSGSFGRVVSARSPRVIQLALELQF